MKKRVARAQYALLWLLLAVNVLGQPAISTNISTPPKPPDKARVLMPGDLVLVTVFQEDDFKSPCRIAQDGTITIPLLDRISVGGKTIEQAESFIRGALDKDYILNPKVTVTVNEHAKWTFTVIGAVQAPGNFEVIEGDKLTLPQALGRAGGANAKGNLSKIQVTRRVGDRSQVFPELDANAMLKDSRIPHFEILPNDVIKVPERTF